MKQERRDERLQQACLSIQEACGCACEYQIPNNKPYLRLDGTGYEVIYTEQPEMVEVTEEQIMVVPQLTDCLRHDAIVRKRNIMDWNGNCLIQVPGLRIAISGQKKRKIKESQEKEAIGTAGVKVIFYLLQDKQNVQKPLRQISDESGVSVNMVMQAIEYLKQEKYVVMRDKNRVLWRRDELVRKWAMLYNDMLKPKLLVKRMGFIKDARQEWENMEMPEGYIWGGDCGANRIDHYLLPGKYEIYGDKGMAPLLRTGKLVPRENGEAYLYRPFWKTISDEGWKVLVYADLMGEMDSRCHEAANRMMGFEK